MIFALLVGALAIFICSEKPSGAMDRRTALPHMRVSSGPNLMSANIVHQY